MRVMWMILSALVLILPAHAQAEISREMREKVIERLCENEMWIDGPDTNGLQEVCQVRFEYGGASLWFAYTTERDLRYEPCPVPKPWCVYPDYTLLIVVRWLAADILDYEEVIIDNGFMGRPALGIENGADRNPREYRVAIKESHWDRAVPAKGVAHLSHWTRRYEELIRVLLSQMDDSKSAM